MAAAGTSLAAAFSCAGAVPGAAFRASLPQNGHASRSAADETPQSEHAAASHVAQAGQRSQAASIAVLQAGHAYPAPDAVSACTSRIERASAAVSCGRASR